MGRKNYTLSLDADIVERSKQVAGLVPFSRFVQDLLVKEIERASSGPKG